MITVNVISQGSHKVLKVQTHLEIQNFDRQHIISELSFKCSQTHFLTLKEKKSNQKNSKLKNIIQDDSSRYLLKTIFPCERPVADFANEFRRRIL